jgi:hypothetical protein
VSTQSPVPEATTGSGSTPSPPRFSERRDALVFLLAAALLGVVVYTIFHYKQNATDAAAVLGIVLPAFAILAAAVLGLRETYLAGHAKGHAEGLRAAEKQWADEILLRIDRASEALRQVTKLLRGRSSRSQGAGAMTAGPQSAELDELLDEVRTPLDELRGLAAGRRSIEP